MLLNASSRSVVRDERVSGRVEVKKSQHTTNSQNTNRGFPSSIKTQLGAENANHTRTNRVAASFSSSRTSGERFVIERRREGYSVERAAR